MVDVPKPERTYTAPELISLSIASLFGAGFVPAMPGTVGSAAAMLVLLIPFADMPLLLLVLGVLSFGLGLAVVPDWCDETCTDPSFVVIDEAAAMWLVLATPLVPHDDWVWMATAFALFRLFDIWKPFPIRLVERRGGAFAVMADDLVAAMYAAVCLHILYFAYLAAPLVWLYFSER